MVLKVLALLAYANFVEYAVHRWLLHGPLWPQHTVHHFDDRDEVIFTRGWKGFLQGAVLIAFNSLLWLFWGWLPLVVFTVYYVVLFELAHWVIHHQTWAWWKRHHRVHHADVYDGNYNIWFPLWDVLLGTRI